MTAKMVRVQVSISRDDYDELKRRAKRAKVPLANEVRLGLRYYLAWTKEADKDGKDLPPFDPSDLFAILDHLSGGGPSDLAENHDKYLYSDPHGEREFARSKEGLQPKPIPTSAARERRTTYRTKSRSTRQRKGKRK